MAMPFLAKLLSGNTKALITAYASGQHIEHKWPSQGPGPDSKCSKTVKVWCSCQYSACQ